MLQKGWVPVWCRSSMDLLQDLVLSRKPSSPFSIPSKSNLGHVQTDGRTDKPTRGRIDIMRGTRGKLGRQGSLGESQGLSLELSSSCTMKLSRVSVPFISKVQLSTIRSSIHPEPDSDHQVRIKAYKHTHRNKMHKQYLRQTQQDIC